MYTNKRASKLLHQEKQDLVSVTNNLSSSVVDFLEFYNEIIMGSNNNNNVRNTEESLMPHVCGKRVQHVLSLVPLMVTI